MTHGEGKAEIWCALVKRGFERRYGDTAQYGWVLEWCETDMMCIGKVVQCGGRIGSELARKERALQCEAVQGDGGDRTSEALA